MAPPESAKRRRIGFVQNDRNHGGRLVENHPAVEIGGDFQKIC